MKTHSKLTEVAHTEMVYCVKIVDKLLVTCGDTTVRIWNITDGKQLHKLQLLGWCSTFDLNSDRTLLAVAHQHGVSIYNFSSLSKLTEIQLFKVMDVRFNEPGTMLIVGQHDGQLTIIKLD